MKLINREFSINLNKLEQSGKSSESKGFFREKKNRIFYQFIDLIHCIF